MNHLSRALSRRLDVHDSNQSIREPTSRGFRRFPSSRDASSRRRVRISRAFRPLGRAISIDRGVVGGGLGDESGPTTGSTTMCTLGVPREES